MATRSRKGSTAARGYGHNHRTERDALAPTVAAGLATCWRCGRQIQPGEPWDLGHDDHDRSITRGPEHRHRTPWCPGNRSRGATLGNKRRRRQPRTTPSPAPTAATWQPSRPW